MGPWHESPCQSLCAHHQPRVCDDHTLVLCATLCLSGQQVKTQLLEHEVVLEEFGGEVLSAEVSAKERLNLDGLLEQLQLQACGGVSSLHARAGGRAYKLVCARTNPRARAYDGKWSMCTRAAPAPL